VSAESRKQRREQVLEAARRVLKQIGIRKLTLEDVAEQAGLATSSLYYYFKNKDALILAVARVELNEITEAIEAEVEAAERFEDKVRAVGQTIVRHVGELSRIPGVSSNARYKLDSQVPKLGAQFKARVLKLIRSTIEQGNAAGEFSVEDPDLTAIFIMAGIRGLVDEILDGQIELDRLKGMQQMSSLLMNGLKKR